MNSELREAIYTRCNGIAGLTGGIYYIEAPQSVSLPYAVFYTVAQPRSFDSSDQFDEVFFSVNCFSDSITVLETLQDLFIGRLHLQTSNFSMSNYYMLGIQLISSQGIRQSGKNDIYQFTQSYKALIQEK